MSRLQMDMRIFNKHLKSHSVQQKLKIKGKKYFFFLVPKQTIFAAICPAAIFKKTTNSRQCRSLLTNWSA